MTYRIRVLFVEDSAEDVELAAQELQNAGYELLYERVDTPAELRRALDDGPWDAVIADEQVFGVEGRTAVQVVREVDMQVPIILYCGTAGEQAAARAARAGVSDYVTRGTLARLPHAVTRELRDAEQRRERKRLDHNQRFLLTVSSVLSESSDYETTLAQVARLAVPHLADWCAIDMLEPDGDLAREIVVHADAMKARWASELQRRHPPSRDAAFGPANVLRTGRAELIEQVTPAGLVALAGSKQELATLQRLGVASYISVPLRARGSNIGALTLVSEREDRRYGAGDLGLAEELARRAAAALDNARLSRQAGEATYLRDEFLAIASHELKTPLTALQLRLQAVREGLSHAPGPATLERISERLEGAMRSAERLAVLIDDLLDVSRMTTRELTIKLDTFDIVDALESVLARFQDAARRSGCALHLKAPVRPVGSWDRRRIEQLLGTLLSNALKYGNGQPIEVAVTTEGGRVLISLTDHGIGIAPADLRRIFRRFERAVPVRHYGGLGLGLYIARRIAEAHGGAVSVTSRPGTGTTFTVELPLSPRDALRPSAQTEAPAWPR